MKAITRILPVILLTFFSSACKDSSQNPPEQAQMLIGIWVYSYPSGGGFADNRDPEHIYQPTFEFRQDLSFEETARFVEYPSLIVRGYKYVKRGVYATSADTLVFTYREEAYLSFADSLQPKPTPVPVTPYYRKTNFKVVADSLGLGTADPRFPNGTSMQNWYRRLKLTISL